MPGTPEFPDHGEDRAVALDRAVFLYRNQYDQPTDTTETDRALRRTAESLFRWLTGPAFLVVQTGPVSDLATGEPVSDPLPHKADPDGGKRMQLRDNEQVTYTVTVASARGNVISDQPGTQDDLTWTLEGGEDVLELTVSEDTRSATVRALGPVGSGVLRVEVGELFATEAIDVVAGEAALLTLAAGEVSDQPSEQPPADEPGGDEGGTPAA